MGPSSEVLGTTTRTSRCHTCYHTCMVKTTIYLPERLKRQLSKLARSQGRPEAQLIREALERLLEETAPPRPTLPLFHAPDQLLAENIDEALKGYGEW
jgi:hypothetical protein